MKDKIVFFIVVLLACVFIYYLPHINHLTRNSAQYMEVEEEQIPISYSCLREYTDGNASVVQNATYYIENEKIKTADIKRVYSFDSKEEYTSYVDGISNDDVVGLTLSYEYDDDNYKVTEKRHMNVFEMSRKDLGNTFPDNYKHLLKYTETQKCDAKY